MIRIMPVTVSDDVVVFLITSQSSLL